MDCIVLIDCIKCCISTYHADLWYTTLHNQQEWYNLSDQHTCVKFPMYMIKSDLVKISMRYKNEWIVTYVSEYLSHHVTLFCLYVLQAVGRRIETYHVMDLHEILKDIHRDLFLVLRSLNSDNFPFAIFFFYGFNSIQFLIKQNHLILSRIFNVCYRFMNMLWVYIYDGIIFMNNIFKVY